jgi:hypothetical protein
MSKFIVNPPKRQAIVTRFLPATGLKNNRVKASSDAGTITLDWNSEIDSESNHRAACEALIKKLQWEGTYAGGWHNGDCVFVPSRALRGQRAELNGTED